jgi:hypothetical protein
VSTPAHRSTVAAGTVLALAASLAFWPVVSGSRSFFHGDLRHEHNPIWHVTQQALLAGESPFWLGGFYCGHPLLFVQEAPLFYPLTVPLLLTGAPVNRLADLFLLFHFWLAGFAAFLLLRDLGSNVVSALFAGLAWMLSARLLQSALWPNAVAAAALLPLVLVGLTRISRGERRSGVVLAAVCGGLALLASRPQVLLAASPLIAVFAFALVALAPKRGRSIGDFALAALLAFLIGSPSLLPSAVLYPETSRAGGLTPADRDPHPLSFGRDLDQVFLPVDGPARWPEAAAYPGLLVALLFLAGLGLSLRSDARFPRALYAALAAGGVIGLAFSFGEGGPYALLADLPVLRSFRLPARFLLSWSLALALASGIALSRLLLNVRRPRLVGAVAVTFLGVDLIGHTWRAAPTAPSSIYDVEPALVDVLSRKLSRDEAGFPQRFLSQARPIPFWLYDDESKLELARRLEPLSGAIGMRWGLEAVNGAGPPMRRIEMVFGAPALAALRLGGAGCVVVSVPRAPGQPPGMPPKLLVQSLSPLPRARLVPEAVIVKGVQSVAAAIDPARDPLRTAVLEEGVPLLSPRRWEGSFGSVRLLARDRSSVEMSASLPAEGVLVLLDSFERGWHAWVDGKRTPVLRADAAFLGVRLRPGTHQVRLEYRPRGVPEGLGLAAIGVLGVFFAARRLPSLSE